MKIRPSTYLLAALVPMNVINSAIYRGPFDAFFQIFFVVASVLYAWLLVERIRTGKA